MDARMEERQKPRKINDVKRLQARCGIMTGSVMANADGVNPTRHEIELQLARMLAHPLLQARELQAEMFAFLVEGFLDGKKIDELALFVKFYNVEQFKAGSTKVRTNVNHTRGLLKEYYDGPGRDDPVIIALPTPKRSSTRKKNYRLVKRPPGEAYKPEFTYNPRAPIAKQFAVAHFILAGGPSQIEQSLWKLDALNKAEPGHPDVALSVAEAVGSQLMLGVYAEDLRAPLIAGMLESIANLKGANVWRVHNVRGLLHVCAGDMEKAKKEFTAALQRDRQSTIRRGWYTYFLLRTGKEEEALQLVGLVAEEHASNAQAQAVRGFYLLEAKRYGEAERAFSGSLALDRNCWPAHYGLTKMHIATGNQEKASEHMKRLEALVEPAEYQILSKFNPPEPSGRSR
jgi:tetratricopeptide (TPR) repeat protein